MMLSHQTNSHQMKSGSGRRSAHVKWDGRTIALGTFPAAEAAEKCEQAKALTRKWRSTMVPKPDVEWVKETLERMKIRIVNDRPRRRRKEEVLEKEMQKNVSDSLNFRAMGGKDQLYGLSAMGRNDVSDSSMLYSPRQGYYSGMSSINADNSMIPGISCGTGNGIMTNGSNMARKKRRFMSESGPNMPQLNSMPMSSNFSSNFDNVLSQKFQLGLPSHDFGMMSGLDSHVSSRQHYGILKEHHDNLMKELRQTKYMMEMYKNNFQ